jgi:hypothetical protein
VVVAPATSQVRAPPAYQLYSRTYYDERVKPKVDAELEGENVSEKDRLAITTRILRETYNQETSEVKAAVEKERKELLARLKENAEAVETMLDPGKEERTPEEFAQYVCQLLTGTTA